MPDENTAEANTPELDLFLGKAGDAVPAVDPTYLKSLWTYSQEIRAQHPQAYVGFCIEAFKQMCSPGADVKSVCYRYAMLSLLGAMIESAWPGGQPSDTTFAVAARMELKWMGVGEAHPGLPFDVGRFLGEVYGRSLYAGGKMS
jgi:hypothetical protein